MTLDEAWHTGSPTLLSINNYYYGRGGADVLFFEQNRMLREIGWNVAPFSMQHPNNLQTSWSKYFVSEIEFGHNYSRWRKLVNAEKVIFSIEARRKLSKLIDHTSPDIAHAHNIYHHISPSILGLLRRRKIPTVLTLHDLKLACPAYKMLTHDGVCERCKPNKLHYVLRHKCIKNSLALSTLVFMESVVHYLLKSYENNIDRFIVPSRFYLEKMVEWGWDRERFSYISNFVDCGLYRPEYKVGRPFVFFGRLSLEKGLHTFINAAAAAQVPIQLAGTGPEEQGLKELAAQTGADIAFLGYRTGEDLFDVVRNARAVVLPSEWYENAPLSVMESYALGKPVIGADIGGIPELIRNGETGATFESGSVDDLTETLRHFMDLSHEELQSMGRQGRAWMESEFTPEKHSERLLSLYAEVGGPPLPPNGASIPE